MGTLVDLHDESRIRVLTLSDPGKLNAIGDDVRNQLAQEVAAAIADPVCRVIVITGAGEAFSSGGELASMPTEAHAIRARMGRLHDIVRMLAGAPQIIIAAVDGVAYGSGLSLAAAADVVVASDRARFGCTFGRVGLIPDVGFMWSVPRRIGVRRARLMVLQNSIIDAAEALEWGLADVPCPAGGALEHALEMASRIARTPMATLAAAKRLLTANHSTLDAVLDDELDCQVALLGTAEFDEARRAFLSRSKR